jgi:hypothetical protein
MPPNRSRIRRGKVLQLEDGLRESFAPPETAHRLSDLIAPVTLGIHAALTALSQGPTAADPIGSPGAPGNGSNGHGNDGEAGPGPLSGKVGAPRLQWALQRHLPNSWDYL